MSRTIIIPTVAALGLALTACGGAPEPVAENAVIANEVDAPPGSMADNTAATAAADPLTAPGFVAAVASSDLFEIESSRIAIDEAQEAETRKFAQMIIADHTKSSNELKTIAASIQPPVTVPTTMMPAMQTQIEALRAVPSEQFDQTYLNQQIPAHEQALTLLRNYSQSGDNAQLQKFATDTIPVIERHLQMTRDMDR